MGGEPNPGQRARVPLATRLMLAVVAIVLVGVALLPAVERRREGRRLEDLARETGIAARQPQVARRALADPDRVRGRLAIARALVAEAYTAEPFAALTLRDAVEATARMSERLEQARAIAVEVLALRPAAWDASMIAGAATYRLKAMRGDPALLLHRDAWEAPLLRAAALAPAEEEPPRLLAFAYLETWPLVSEHERAQARPVLARAFDDPATFSRLAPAWLEAAGSAEQAASLVPAKSAAWSRVEGLLGRRRDWQGMLSARQRREEALAVELERDIGEMEARLAGGDEAGGRALALSVVGAAPPDRRWAPFVERVLRRLPPTAGAGGRSPAFAAWLEWALDGFTHQTHSLSPEVVARLLGSLELTLPERALALLAAGDLVAAEQVERRSEALNTEPWAPYCIAKSRALAARGELRAAGTLLARTQPAWRSTAAYLLTTQAIGRASGREEQAAAADAALSALTSRGATAWRWRGSRAWTDVWVEEEGAGTLEIAVDTAPKTGAVLRLRVDGGVVRLAEVGPGGSVSFPIRLEGGVHLVEVDTLAGGRVVPGALRTRR